MILDLVLGIIFGLILYKAWKKDTLHKVHLFIFSLLYLIGNLIGVLVQIAVIMITFLITHLNKNNFM